MLFAAQGDFFDGLLPALIDALASSLYLAQAELEPTLAAMQEALGMLSLSAQTRDFFRPALHSVAARVSAASQGGDLRHIFLAIGA